MRRFSWLNRSISTQFRPHNEMILVSKFYIALWSVSRWTKIVTKQSMGREAQLAWKCLLGPTSGCFWCFPVMYVTLTWYLTCRHGSVQLWRDCPRRLLDVFLRPNNIMARSDVTEIFRFNDFADLAGKCMYLSLLGSYLWFWPLKLWYHCSNTKVCKPRGDMLYDTAC